MLLSDRVAVVYGGGGLVGSAIARGLANEGAKVHLAGRSRRALDKAAKAIGDGVETAVVDALDADEVKAFTDSVVKADGALDISVNVIGIGDVQKPLARISIDDFMQPVENALRSHFITDTNAVRHMAKKKRGVILTFGGGGPQTVAGLGGFKVALDALEGLRRQFAVEYGDKGIRVVTIKTNGMLESVPESSSIYQYVRKSIVDDSMLKHAPTFAELGRLAAFLASDVAASITSTEINFSAGAIPD